MVTPSDAVTIRPSYPDDEATLRRLAALDSAVLPGGPCLLAEVHGQVRAAVSLADGRTIADPFAPTRRLVALLHQYAAPDPNAVRPGTRPFAKRGVLGLRPSVSA